MPFQAAKLKKVYASPKSKPCPHCLADGGEVEDVGPYPPGAMERLERQLEEFRNDPEHIAAKEKWDAGSAIGKAIRDGILSPERAAGFRPKRVLTDQERAQSEEGPDTRPVNRGDSTTRYEQLPGGVTKIEIQGKAKGGVVKCSSCGKHYACGGKVKARKMADGGPVTDPKAMGEMSEYLSKMKAPNPSAIERATSPGDRSPADWKNSEAYDLGVTERLPKRRLESDERLAWKRRPRPAPGRQIAPSPAVASGQSVVNVRTGEKGPRTYAHGGIVSKGGNMAQSRRHDGVKGATGKNSPYEFLQDRKTMGKFQKAFNNERKGNTEPVRSFASGGVVAAEADAAAKKRQPHQWTEVEAASVKRQPSIYAKGGTVPARTGISFAAKLASDDRRKPFMGTFRKAKP